MGKWLAKFSTDIQGSLPDIPDIVPSVSGVSVPHKGRVRLVEHAETVESESATPHAKAIYFVRQFVGIVGPATVDFVTQVGEGPAAQYWLFVTYDGLPSAVNSTWLRSQREFETQVRLKPVELIREPR